MANNKEEINKSEEIAILGSGITGLFIGYFLVKKGYKVSLIEKENYSGGALQTFSYADDIKLEKFYHHILSFNKELLHFIEEIGLSENLIRNSCPLGIIKDGRISPINSLRQVGILKGMTLYNILKTSWLGFNIFFFPNSKKWDNMTAEELITRYCGSNIWYQMCYPMIRAKFGNRNKEVSGQWLVNKLRQKMLIRKENSGEKLIYLKGSFQKIIDYLEKYILDNGSNIYFQSTVEKITIEDNRISDLLVNGKKFSFEKVISTMAEPALHRIIKSNISSENSTSGINYSHSLCAVFRLKKKLSDFYWLYNLDEAMPFAALIEHSNLTGSSLYNGESVLYIARYLDSIEELYKYPDADIIDRYIHCLEEIYPEFDKNDIINTYLFRQPYAQPIYDKGYLKRIPPHNSEIKGLYSVNMSQLFPQGRTLENCYLMARNFTESF